MEIRQAILKAADHIGARQDEYAFMVCSVPDGCGSPGCAIGWIAHFRGRRKGTAHDICPELMGVSAQKFYGRMSALLGGDAWMEDTDDGRDGDATLTAKGLRLYAEKYHPEED